MKEKLNIAELLKDCPKGMELDCTMFNNVTFVSVDDKKGALLPIKVLIEGGISAAFSKYGQYKDADFAKCVIFPKGKTTWEGFKRPFKDGDVVTYKLRGSLVAFIYKKRTTTMLVKTHFALYAHNMGFCVDNDIALREEEIEFATEEEKQKLFDAIKANGYKWNAETKTLETLIKPKFKVGDRVKHKDGCFSGEVTKIDGEYFILKYDSDAEGSVDIRYQDDYELVPNKFDITTLKPFDKVLVRNGSLSKWDTGIFSRIIKSNNKIYFIVNTQHWEQCIPYEGNKHLLDTTNDCEEYYKTWE